MQPLIYQKLCPCPLSSWFTDMVEVVQGCSDLRSHLPEPRCLLLSSQVLNSLSVNHETTRTRFSWVQTGLVNNFFLCLKVEESELHAQMVLQWDVWHSIEAKTFKQRWVPGLSYIYLILHVRGGATQIRPRPILSFLLFYLLFVVGQILLSWLWMSNKTLKLFLHFIFF